MQAYLGICYHTGKHGLPIDTARSQTLLHAASLHYNLHSLAMMGMTLEKLQPASALKNYILAASQADQSHVYIPAVWYKIGWMHEHGNGTAKNLEVANEW